MLLSDASTQGSRPPVTVDAGTQESPPWQDQVITDSRVTQMSPPKRPKRDEPPLVPPEFTEPLADQTVQDGVRHTLQARWVICQSLLQVFKLRFKKMPKMG